MYHTVPPHMRNEAIMLHDFQRNSPDGRLDKHSARGRGDGDVEQFPYNQGVAEYSQA